MDWNKEKLEKATKVRDVFREIIEKLSNEGIDCRMSTYQYNLLLTSLNSESAIDVLECLNMSREEIIAHLKGRALASIEMTKEIINNWEI